MTHGNAYLVQDLPTQTGVYYFYDGAGDVIYVGKSINIKKRVQSHFSAAKRDAKEAKLARYTKKIVAEITPGELSALLLESAEIKRLQPIYNRRLRRRSKFLTWSIERHGSALRPKLVPEVWPPNDHKQYGSYRNMRHAHTSLRSLIKSNELCAKVLGLEQSGISCFAYQLKQCRGACVAQETLSSHNQRFENAMQTKALDDWPYCGAIGVIEDSAPDDMNVFNGWRFLGVFDRQEINQKSGQCNSKEGNQGADKFKDWLSATPSHILDRDSYKIVLSFLKRRPADIEIVDLSLS